MNRRFSFPLLLCVFASFSAMAQSVPQQAISRDIITAVSGRNVFIVACTKKLSLLHGPIWRLKKIFCQSGSGINLGNGKVLSAYHVVDAHEKIFVNNSAEEIVGFDQKTDLVLLSFKQSNERLPALSLKTPKSGELILSVGSPTMMSKLSIEFVTGHKSWSMWWSGLCHGCKLPKGWQTDLPNEGLLTLSTSFAGLGSSGGGQYSVNGELTGVHEGAYADGTSVTISAQDIDTCLRRNGTTLTWSQP